jgi:hypothetical protein
MSEIIELKLNLETCLESKMPAHLDKKQIEVLLDELARLEKREKELVEVAQAVLKYNACKISYQKMLLMAKKAIEEN